MSGASKTGVSILQNLLDRGVGLLPTGGKRPVVIHFDVNRTIIQIDPAGGKLLGDVLNNNLASVCYGHVALHTQAKGTPVPDWLPAKGPTDPAPATAEDTAVNTDKPTLMTYDVYVDDYVVPPVPKAAMEGLTTSQAYDAWDAMSKKRRALKNSFSNDGQPGAVYHDHWTALHKAMSLESDSSQTHFIIPSAWECINALSVLSWPFTVVIRTFGNDGPEILSEWEKFVMGQLEVAPQGPMLAALSAEYAAKRHKEGAQASIVKSGRLYRSELGSFLQWGSPVAATVHKEVDAMMAARAGDATTTASEASDVTAAALKAVRQGLERDHLAKENFVQMGAQELYELMALQPQATEEAKTMPQVLALVDFYPWWSQHRESPQGGKVFPVVTNNSATAAASTAGSSTAVHPYQVFFDDNIELPPCETSIVDIKEAATGVFIHDRATQERLLVRAEPYKAIMNRVYFVEELAAKIEAQHKASM